MLASTNALRSFASTGQHYSFYSFVHYKLRISKMSDAGSIVGCFPEQPVPVHYAMPCTDSWPKVGGDTRQSSRHHPSPSEVLLLALGSSLLGGLSGRGRRVVSLLTQAVIADLWTQLLGL